MRYYQLAGLVILILIWQTLCAQDITGNLIGRVTDHEGRALQDVEIIVEGRDIQGTRGTVSDEQGNFRLLALPVGVVAVEVSHVAYHIRSIPDTKIALGKTVSLGDIQLVPLSIEASEVTVIGEKNTIDPNTTTIGANITPDLFETLPIERDYLSITSLLPQANTSYLGDDVNISGATGQENAYFIDGMNTTDPYRAIGGSRLPYNFVKEIEVKSGGYEAEFGRATGGIVNVITYSGGNEFHGKAFGFFTGSGLSSNASRGIVDVRTGDFTRYDAGISLGGPVIIDKLWFYLAYNNQLQEEDIEFEGLGTETDKTIANIFAAKLTWQATPKTNILFSVFGDPSNQDRIGSNFPGGTMPAALANPDPFLGKWGGCPRK